MRTLLAHAAHLGTAVTLAAMEDDPHLLGYYSSARRCVVVRLGMSRCWTRWVLAHELGHAFYDHTCADAREAPANERQADQYAARLLIDPDDYARLEQIHHDAHWLADELGVPDEAVYAYRRYWRNRPADAGLASLRARWSSKCAVA